MIKDLNGLTVLMLVVTILAAIFLAWLYTKPGKKWLDELVYRRWCAILWIMAHHLLYLASNRSSFLMLLPAFFTLAFKSPIR